MVDFVDDLIERFKNSKIMSKILIISYFVLYILIISFTLIRLNYSVLAPGYLHKAEDSVEIATDNSRGNINLVSVISYEKANIIQCIIASLDKRFDISPREDIATSEVRTYSIILKKISIEHSIIYAYQKAKEVDPSIFLSYSFAGLIVAERLFDTDLNQYDLITSIEGVKITSLEQFKEELNKILASKKENDYITFSVLKYNSKDKTYQKSETIVNTTCYKYEDKLVLGLTLLEKYDINSENSNPTFNITYNELLDASGPSGGAMLTLSIYNGLLDKDVTSGLVIAGTGTINLDGTIGRIGGIDQKSLRAYYSNVDIFFVDNNYSNSDGKTDYQLALEACKLYGIDSSFIKGVKTFEEILEVLERGT